MIKDSLQLFLTGFIQVYLVSVNTCFLAKSNYHGVAVAAFLISFVWSHNVKRVVFGTMVTRMVYSVGASAGSLLGLYSSEFIIHIISKILQ